MPNIGENQSANGRFFGSGAGRGSANDNYAITSGGETIPESASRAKPKPAPVQVEEAPAPPPPKPEPRSGPSNIAFDSNHILGLPKANVVVSPTIPSGTCWHFSYSNSYMVNKDDWRQAIETHIADLQRVMDSALWCNNEECAPTEDPEMGPLIALIGNTMLAVNEKKVE